MNSRGKRGGRSPLMLTDSLRRASELGPEKVRLHLAQQMQMCCKHKHGGGGDKCVHLQAPLQKSPFNRQWEDGEFEGDGQKLLQTGLLIMT